MTPSLPVELAGTEISLSGPYLLPLSPTPGWHSESLRKGRIGRQLVIPASPGTYGQRSRVQSCKLRPSPPRKGPRTESRRSERILSGHGVPSGYGGHRGLSTMPCGKEGLLCPQVRGQPQAVRPSPSPGHADHFSKVKAAPLQKAVS